MKKVLWITTHFPPEMNVASVRNIKLLKYLPKFGWDATVICAGTRGIRKGDEKNFYPETQINRVAFYKFYRFLYYLFCPVVSDQDLFWCLSMLPLIKRILCQQKIDCVYTSCSPFSLNCLGLWIHKVYGLPWLTDFRDLWTLNINFRNRGKYFCKGKILAYLERITMNNCDGFIVNTLRSKDRMIAKYPCLNGKTIVIPNGFDSEDIESPNEDIESNRTSFFFGGTINFHSDYHPGFLLRILKSCVDKGLLSNKCEVHYAGHSAESFRKLMCQEKLELPLKMHGHLPLDKYYQLIQQMNTVFIWLPEDSDTSSWIPARFYDYIGLKKKIICSVQTNTELEVLVKEYGAGIVLHYADNIDKACLEVTDFINEEDVIPSGSFIGNYTRELHARNLAAFFDRISIHGKYINI